MADRVGVRELRQHVSAVLRRVAAGETVEVTDHGRPVARIVPLVPGVLGQLAMEGRATEAEGALLDVLDELALPSPGAGAMSPSEALAELRAEGD